MAGKPVKIAILADARDATRGFDKAGDAAQDAGRKFDGMADGADEVASKGAQAAGALSGLGDLIGGQLGGAMVVAGTGMQAAADAGDLLNAAVEGGGKLVKKAAGFARSLGRAETYAAAAKKASAVAQRVLNAAMRANPIGLVVTAIILLVTAIVILWKKNKTFRKIVLAVWGAIKKAAGAVWDWIKNKIVKNVVAFVTSVPKRIKALKAKMLASWTAIKSKVRETWDAIKNKIADVWRGIVEGVRDRITAVVERVRGLKDKVQNALSNAGTWLVDAGKDLIQGLWDGIKSLGGWLKDKIIGFVVDNVPGPVAKVLDLGSPSKLFRKYGQWTVEGLALGIEGNARTAEKASTMLAGAVAGGFNTGALGDSARSALRGSAGAGGNTYHITVTAPVGSSSAEIGRTLTKHIEAYERSGGRRRA